MRRLYGQTCLADMTLGSCDSSRTHNTRSRRSARAARRWCPAVSGVAPSSPQLLVPLSAPSSLRREAGAAEPSLRDPGGHRVGAAAHTGGLLLAPPLLLRAHRHLLGVPGGGEWNTLHLLLGAAGGELLGPRRASEQFWRRSRVRRSDQSPGRPQAGRWGGAVKQGSRRFPPARACCSRPCLSAAASVLSICTRRSCLSFCAYHAPGPLDAIER